MHRIDGDGSVNGKWVEEDAEASRRPTQITPEWMNAIQEELASFIESAGLELKKLDNTQLAQALEKWIAAKNFQGKLPFGPMWLDRGMIADLNAAPSGYGMFQSLTANRPPNVPYGVVCSFNGARDDQTPANGIWEMQVAYGTSGTTAFRCNINGSGWSDWRQMWDTVSLPDPFRASGGRVTGPIDLYGSANELQFTDTQQPITLGRFRVVSSGGMLIVDRNTASDGSFSTFVRTCTIDGNGNMSTPASILADLFKTRANINLPAYNNDGRGFLEFGGDTVIWRLFMPGPSGNLILNSYNTDGTNRHQPFYIDYVSGKFVFASRPSFNGATPWDSGNLPNPLTTDGGWLNANRGLIFGVGYGRGALQVSSNGTDSIGGAFTEWNASRSPALQIDCPSNVGAYMGIRWTQWGMRHLAAIDCYAGGSDASVPYISMHVGGRVNAFTFGGSGTLVAQGDIHAGNGGGILASNGNVYMTWAGQWLSDYLSNLNGGKAGAGAICQWNTAITEFGGVSTGERSGQADLPAPYVLVGLRNTFYLHYLRAVQLRNQ